MTQGQKREREYFRTAGQLRAFLVRQTADSLTGHMRNVMVTGNHYGTRVIGKTVTRNALRSRGMIDDSNMWTALGWAVVLLFVNEEPGWNANFFKTVDELHAEALVEDAQRGRGTACDCDGKRAPVPGGHSVACRLREALNLYGEPTIGRLHAEALAEDAQRFPLSCGKCGRPVRFSESGLEHIEPAPHPNQIHVPRLDEAGMGDETRAKIYNEVTGTQNASPSHAAVTAACPNGWHQTAPARALVLCPECQPFSSSQIHLYAEQPVQDMDGPPMSDTAIALRFLPVAADDGDGGRFRCWLERYQISAQNLTPDQLRSALLADHAEALWENSNPPIDRIVRRAKYNALREVLAQLDDAIEGQKSNHEALGHRDEFVWCWDRWHPNDIRRMVNDAARATGTREPWTGV
jgi:hypothetical protein